MTFPFVAMGSLAIFQDEREEPWVTVFAEIGLADYWETFFPSRTEILVVQRAERLLPPSSLMLNLKGEDQGAYKDQALEKVACMC